MSPNTPTIDQHYRRYIELLLQHHRLLSAQMDDTKETEAVEAEMYFLWEHLDPIQQPSLSGLGSDLTWVRRQCVLAPRARRPEEVTVNDFQALTKAHNEGDWHGLLHCLRVCAPRATPFQLANLRALAWATLQFPQLARLFYEVAAEVEPSRLLLLSQDV